MEEIPWWWQKVYKEWIIVERLADVILHFVKGCIVEIGVGHSTVILGRQSKRLGIKHYAIDTDSGKCKNIEDNPKIMHDNMIIFNGASLDFIDLFDDTPALVFIDGCHDSEVVIQEAMFFLHHLLPGGVMFLHDTHPNEEWKDRLKRNKKFLDTYKVRWELENTKSVWCFTWPYTARAAGLTMVVKRPEYEYTLD